MNSRRSGREAGFVLATVVVFLVVLSLSAFLTAALTQTNLRIVNNIQDEKESFYIAEAGVAEGVIRLAMDDPTLVAVDELTFNAAIVPDRSDPVWTAYILFDGALPAKVGSTLRTPTIQPASARLPYSAVTAPGAEKALTIAWDRDPLTGLVRKVKGQPVLNVVAVGQAGAARRQVRVQATDDGGAGVVILEPTGCSSVHLQGGADVSVASRVMINSSCARSRQALQLSNNSSLSSDDAIDVTGGYNGQGVASPVPNTGVDPIPDPLASLPVPSGLPASAADCTATGTSFSGGTRTLSPGVYCDGLSFQGTGTTTLAPGTYVIAGGVLGIGGNHVVTGAGVTFYVTRHPATGSYASVDLGPNLAINLSAPLAGTYAGILIFQDRDNPSLVQIRGTFASGLDGTIYAKSGALEIQNQGIAPKELNLELVVNDARFTGDTNFNRPLLPIVSTATSKGLKVIAWND